MAALSLTTAIGAMGGASLVSGCAVSDADLTRWQGTEHGPEKLYAVLTHPKYSQDLRVQSAMSLVKMSPRDGNRVGLHYLVDGYDNGDGTTTPGALTILPDDQRQAVVAAMTPLLIAGMKIPIPAPRADGCLEPDPSIPYKDAAFAMLTHDPALVNDDQNKNDLNAGLLSWLQSAFEARVDNSAQEYPTDKVMAYLGKASVSTLPSLVNEKSDKIGRMATLVQQLGDDDTKTKMSQALVDLAKTFESADWVTKTTAKIKQVDSAKGAKVDDSQVAGQLKDTQKNKFLDPTNGVFTPMKAIGMRPIIDYCIDFAVTRKTMDIDLRKGALAALEGNVFKVDTKDAATKAANQKDIDRLFSIVADETSPDDLRSLALQRLNDAPNDIIKTSIIPKLYTLFDGKKWQTRSLASSLILTHLQTSDIKDFLGHLPKTPDEKMSMTEAVTYGIGLASAKPGSGGPKARDVLNGFTTVKDIGPKLVAFGSYFPVKKADAQGLSAGEADTSPVPKCDPKDGCGWSDTGCLVPKQGGKPGETEKKTIDTVGDFVKYCIEPNLK